MGDIASSRKWHLRGSAARRILGAPGRPAFRYLAFSHQPAEIICTVSRYLRRLIERQQLVIAGADRAIEIGEQLIAQRCTINTGVQSGELVPLGPPLCS